MPEGVGNFNLLALFPLVAWWDSRTLGFSGMQAWYLDARPGWLHLLTPGLALAIAAKFAAFATGTYAGTYTFAWAQPCGFNTRSVEAGYFTSLSAARRGRFTISPPQFGHTPFNTDVAQSVQKVHSKVQIRASVESGGRSLSQHSQLGRI